MRRMLNDLADHAGVTIHTVELPDDLGAGVYWPTGDGAWIFLDDRLPDHEAVEVLAHELAHHARGGGVGRCGMPPTWRPLVARDERECDLDAAGMLIDVEELAGYADELAGLGYGIHPQDVMREWEVSWRVACDALDNLTRRERDRDLTIEWEPAAEE